MLYETHENVTKKRLCLYCSMRILVMGHQLSRLLLLFSFNGGNSSRDRTSRVITRMTKTDTETKTMTTHPIFGVERNIDIPCSTFPKLIFPTIEEIEHMESLLPICCQHGWFPSAYDSTVQLHYRKFIPSTGKPIKAIVVWMHGISAHSGAAFITKSGRKLNQALLSTELLQNDIALYSFDMYGHGYSEGTRAFIPGTWDQSNMQDYINFINTIVVTDPATANGTANANANANVPIFLSGESYGGCLTLHVAKYYQDTTLAKDAIAKSRIDSILLNSPAVIGDLPPYPVVFILRYILAPLYPKWIPFFMPNPVSTDRVFSDPEVQQQNAITSRYMNMGIDMIGRPFRLATAVNLLLALQTVRTTVIPKLTIPFLCQHGTSDYAVPISGSELLYNNSLTKTDNDTKRFIQHTGAYHDLLAEHNAEEIVQNMIQWISQRLVLLSSNK